MQNMEIVASKLAELWPFYIQITTKCVYGGWMISRHIFNLRTGQNGFSEMAIAQSFSKNKINPS